MGIISKLGNNSQLTDEFIEEIKYQIKVSSSPRHVPSKIIKVSGIPYTINGKKVEIAVKKILEGRPVTNIDSLINPEVLNQYKDLPELMA